VVLANTERVYIDGELLQRGEDRDYVINYNTAEVTFTPKRMITKDSRVQVDFEYADRNYLNANLYLTNTMSFNNKLRVTISAFNNSDAKHRPSTNRLMPARRPSWATWATVSTKPITPWPVSIRFRPGKSCTKRSILPTTMAWYTIRYFNIPPAPTAPAIPCPFPKWARATAIMWPISPAPTGRYTNGGAGQQCAPGRFYARYLPGYAQKAGAVSLAADYDISKRTNITTEVAYSNYDVNTFSTKDKADNKGYAAKVQLKNTMPLGGAKKLQLVSNAGYEMVDARFHPLERLRNVEFNRDWNLPQITIRPRAIAEWGYDADRCQRNSLHYDVVNYRRGDGFNGTRLVVAQSRM